MAVTSSIQMIGDKAVVGALDVSFLPGVPILPGTFVANGPAYFGAGVPVPTAGVMIGPPINLPVPVSLEVKGVVLDKKIGLYAARIASVNKISKDLKFLLAFI